MRIVRVGGYLGHTPDRPALAVTILPPSYPDVPTVYDPSTLPTVFLHIARLPATCRPARVVRHNGMTVLWAHPGILRAVVVMWAIEHLTEDERRAFRLAYGMDPDLSAPPDDEQMAGRMSYLDSIPPILRLPYVRRARRERQSA